MPPPSASYHPDMSATADERAIVPGRVSDVGMAEPERGARCEWATRGAIRNLDGWHLGSDERPRRRS